MDDYRLALQRLAAGDYARGWPLYDARATTAGTGISKPPLPWPEWQGDDLGGRKLLVWPEQGLGDKIMFARYLRPPPGELIVLCEPALHRLFAANLSATVIAASGRTEFPDPDVWTMYGSLPARLRAGAPSGEPYLTVAPSPARAAIGVCSRGNRVHPNDANRSLGPADAARLLSLPGAMSLHYDDQRNADLMETAAIIAGLDLVVTVDTAIAHLAGALGKPVWVLLPAVGTDWRWGRAGESTPWYDSMRLFRQAPGEPWSAVLDRVETALGSRR